MRPDQYPLHEPRHKARKRDELHRLDLRIERSVYDALRKVAADNNTTATQLAKSILASDERVIRKLQG